MKKNLKSQMSNVKSKRKKLLVLLAAAVVFLLILPSRNNQNPSYTPTPQAAPQLSEEERFILDPPTASATSSAKEKHKQIVASLAKQVESIEIKNCRPNPLVVETKLGEEIKIKNSDNVEHKIIIDSKNIFNIPPGAEKIVKTSFKYGPGDYGYVCEGAGIVGFLHVVN